METDKLNNKKIAIIGMGHIGHALLQGLEKNGFKKENIFVSDISSENKKVAAAADWIILAVKPGIVSAVISEIKDCLTNKIIFSVAAAITVGSIEKYVGNKNQKIIRLMPNLPVAYGQGVIGIYNNNAVSDQEKHDVMTVLSGLGTVIDCKEETDLDAMTILSGSGPAVVAYFISLLEKSGEAFGFDKENAAKIANQTFVGTLTLLNQTKQTAEELQQAVATKGGTTEQIIQALEKEKIAARFMQSLDKGYARIKKIAQ